MKKGFVKKTVSTALAVLVSCPAVSANAMIKTDKQVRDPCVILSNDTYYMYGTGLSWPGYGCCKSTDLINWSGNVPVFTPSADFDGTTDFWAPECHCYNGSYYLFATYRSAVSGKRGVAVFRCDTPDGQFEMISDGHVTPSEHDSIDGTLYIDENGDQWMVYVSEWTSNDDEIGEMAAARLSDDLSHFVSSPVTLFRADDPLWTDDHVTDGPWLYRTSGGRLIMLWSNFDDGGYCIGVAYSSNGKIDGVWHHQPVTLYSKTGGRAADAGHSMLFTDKEGRLMLSAHSPNGATENDPTTAVFFEVEDTGDTLVLKEDCSRAEKAFLKVYYRLADIFNPVNDGIKSFFSSLKKTC